MLNQKIIWGAACGIEKEVARAIKSREDRNLHRGRVPGDYVEYVPRPRNARRKRKIIIMIDLINFTARHSPSTDNASYSVYREFMQIEVHLS